MGLHSPRAMDMRYIPTVTCAISVHINWSGGGGKQLQEAMCVSMRARPHMRALHESEGELETERESEKESGSDKETEQWPSEERGIYRKRQDE